MSLKLNFKKWPLPAKGLFLFIILILGLSFLFAPQPKKVNWNEVSFSTTSSSLLYFKNVRSYYYNIYPKEKAPFTLYRLKRRVRDTNTHYLQFMIVHNPLLDEAYLFAEISPKSQSYSSLSVKFENGENFSLSQNIRNEGYFELGAKVLNALIQNKMMYLCSAKDTLTELFYEKKSNLNAETVLEDYFKLVNKQ